MIKVTLTTLFCLCGVSAFESRDPALVYAEDDINFADCLFQIQGTQFDLTELRLPVSSDLADSPTYEVTYTTSDGQTNSLQWNICNVNARRCQDNKQDYANVVNQNQTCTHLTETLDDGTPGIFEFLNPTDPSVGVRILYEGGDKCQNYISYSLSIDVLCDESLAKEPSISYLRSDECAPRVEMKSVHGCPIQASTTLYRFATLYWPLVGTVYMLIGLPLLLCSTWKPKLTSCAVVSILFALLLVYTIFAADQLIPADSPVWTVWPICYFAIGMGVGMSVVTLKWPRVGTVILGAVLGSLVGYCFDMAIVQFITSNDLATTLTVSFCGLAGAVLSLYL